MAAENNLSKGQWEQIPLIHTPKEIHGIAHDLLREDHPHLGGMYADGSGNDLRYRGENKESAAGECDKACRLAHEHLPHGSHVVEYRRATTHPDRFIITEMTAKIPEDARKQWEANIPMRRGGLPDEVAKVALFLASDLASYVSGQVINVCGAMNT